MLMYTYMSYLNIHHTSPTSMQNKSQSLSFLLKIGNCNPHRNSSISRYIKFLPLNAKKYESSHSFGNYIPLTSYK